MCVLFPACDLAAESLVLRETGSVPCVPFPHGDPTANSLACSTETRGDVAAPAAQAEPQAVAGGRRMGGTALGLRGLGDRWGQGRGWAHSPSGQPPPRGGVSLRTIQKKARKERERNLYKNTPPGRSKEAGDGCRWRRLVWREVGLFCLL